MLEESGPPNRSIHEVAHVRVLELAAVSAVPDFGGELLVGQDDAEHVKPLGEKSVKVTSLNNEREEIGMGVQAPYLSTSLVFVIECTVFGLTSMVSPTRVLVSLSGLSPPPSLR